MEDEQCEEEVGDTCDDHLEAKFYVLQDMLQGSGLQS